MKRPELATYLVKKNKKLLDNSALELDWSKKLSPSRAQEYLFTRGYARQMLSDIYKLDPLNIPLYSPPGEIPKLKKGFGHLSMSHCKDASFIGWSKYPIGVDIEQKSRKFGADKIIKYYSDKEIKFLSKNFKNQFKEKVLEYWIIKEAAFKISGGVLIRDLKNLIIDENNKTVYIKQLNVDKKFCLSYFTSWKIGIVYDSKIEKIQTKICY